MNRKTTKAQSLTRRIIIAAAVALCGLHDAIATEWNVSTVAALTNAVTQAMPGDKIILAQGKYTFTDEWMLDDGTGKNLLVITNDNITIEGAVATPRATWTDGAEPVIIDGNGVGSIIKADQNNKTTEQWSYRNRVTLKNITFTGAAYRGVAFADPVKSAQYDFIKCTNCVFRQNTCSTGSAVLNNGELRDCLVTNNTASVSGTRIVASSVAYGCDIVGNAATGTSVLRNASAYDCMIRGNTANNIVNGVDSNDPKIFSNCTFVANATTADLSVHGEKFLDCTFENNTSGQWIVQSTDSGAQLSSCTDCKFISNRVVNGVLRNPTAGGRLSGCKFIDNYSSGTPGSAVYFGKTGNVTMRIEDCDFIGNCSGSTSAERRGGAIYMNRTATSLLDMVVTNCLFECNTNSAFGGAIYNNAGNLPSGESAWEHFLVQDCVFKTNRASYTAGVFGVRAVGCTFDGNVKKDVNSWNLSGNAAAKSYLQNCDINDAELADCIVDRCRIHHVTNTCYIFTGVTAVTNTLVEHCACAPSVVDSAALLRPSSSYLDSSLKTTQFSANFMNCTFVKNRFATYSSDRADYSATNGISFVNCLFNENQSSRINYTAYHDTDFHVIADSNPDMIDYVTFKNSYYGTFYAFNPLIAAKFATWTNSVNALSLCANPKFVGLDAEEQSRYPNEPYWALSTRSPLLGKGNLMDFTAEDFDLAGRRRVRDGMIDIGCYQCWNNRFGLTIIFR